MNSFLIYTVSWRSSKSLQLLLSSSFCGAACMMMLVKPRKDEGQLRKVVSWGVRRTQTCVVHGWFEAACRFLCTHRNQKRPKTASVKLFTFSLALFSTGELKQAQRTKQGGYNFGGYHHHDSCFWHHKQSIRQNWCDNIKMWFKCCVNVPQWQPYILVTRTAKDTTPTC